MKSSKKVNRTILAQYASGLQCAPSETVRGFESHPLRHILVDSIALTDACFQIFALIARSFGPNQLRILWVRTSLR